jgi:hypothetical protein
MRLEFSRQIFEKVSNTKLHQNPTSGSRIVPCVRTDRQTDRRTDMTNLIVGFRNFADAPKNTTRCENHVEYLGAFAELRKTTIALRVPHLALRWIYHSCINQQMHLWSYYICLIFSTYIFRSFLLPPSGCSYRVVNTHSLLLVYRNQSLNILRNIMFVLRSYKTRCGFFER